jgi:flagellin
MALSIGTNISALDAAAALFSLGRNIETSMERLSTGKRINSASDDAAGVGISSRLSAEIRGTNQAIRNTLDAQALIDTAEGAHKEVENILQRMREIGVQAMNDTNSTQDRANLDTEFVALKTEIDRVASGTAWAGQVLMDTGDSTFSFQVGGRTDNENQVNVTIKSMRTADIGGDAAGLRVNMARTRTLGEAEASITIIDDALKDVNTQRSELGAVSNGLNHTINNLTNMSTNLSAAVGGIEDADFAIETTKLAKNQILQRAATAMLAQANASKQSVLTLLRT